MTIIRNTLSAMVLGAWLVLPAQAASGFLTTADQQHLLSSQPTLWQQPLQQGLPLLQIDSQQQFQSMDGFGYTLTGGSAMHIMRLEPARRQQLLQELFARDQMAISYLRLSIGASDLDSEAFSYNDLPPGQTDPELTHFSIKADERYLIPLLKEILAINPEISLLGSPWSPPAWMKSNQSTVGGELLTRFYPAYARYFVRYIQAMQAHGIRIDAITVQNEPLNAHNNPSLLMHAWDQAAFVGQHLGPAFQAAGIKTKIQIYDHNTDHVEYAISVLNDPVARPYIDGSAFHLYGGEISDLTALKQAHPDKHIYFTEQWVGAGSAFDSTLLWHIEHLIIGAPAHWAKNVLQWNLAADREYKPYTAGGCNKCLGALTIDQQQIERNVAYYIIAHASKTVPPGSIRLASHSALSTVKHIAYRRPDQRVALILLNTETQPQPLNLQLEHQLQPFSLQLPARAVLSLILPEQGNNNDQ